MAVLLPDGAPDEVQQCVICRARTPRFVVLSLNVRRLERVAP